MKNSTNNERFYDLNHADMYLRHTVIRVESIPAYITAIGGSKKAGFSIEYVELGDIHNKLITALGLKTVDLSPLPLGMMNYFPGKGNLRTVIISRIPVRRWKVGLDTRNMLISSIAGDRHSIFLEPGQVILSADLKNTIMGKFPTYKEAINSLESSSAYSSVAFNRHFAIKTRGKGKNELIYYKFDTPIGICGPTKPLLSPEFMFLKEHLDEVLKHE